MSECVFDYEYDLENQILIIHFQKRGTYEYEDVPDYIVAGLATAGSLGRYFNLYIRPHYTGKRTG